MNSPADAAPVGASRSAPIPGMVLPTEARPEWVSGDGRVLHFPAVALDRQITGVDVEHLTDAEVDRFALQRIDIHDDRSGHRCRRRTRTQRDGQCGHRDDDGQ